MMEAAVDLRIRPPLPCYPRLARAGAGRNVQPLPEQGFFAGVEPFRSGLRNTEREVGFVRLWHRVIAVFVLVLLWSAPVSAWSRACACSPGSKGGGVGGPPTIQVGGQTYMQLPTGMWVKPDMYHQSMRALSRVRTTTFMEQVAAIERISALIFKAGVGTLILWQVIDRIADGDANVVIEWILDKLREEGWVIEP